MSSNEIHVPRGLMVHLLQFCGRDTATVQRDLGLSPQATRDIMDGTAKFSPLKASRLAALCGVSFDELRYLVDQFPFVTHDPAIREDARVCHPIRGEGRVLESGIGSCRIRLDDKSRVISDVPLAVFQKFDIRKVLEGRSATDTPAESRMPEAEEPTPVMSGTPAPAEAVKESLDEPVTFASGDTAKAAPPVQSATGQPPRGQSGAGDGLPTQVTAEQFKAIVRRGGKTLAQMAAGLGLSTAMISNYISGRYQFPAQRMPQLVETSGLPRDEILEICSDDGRKAEAPLAKTSIAVKMAAPRAAAGRAPAARSFASTKTDTPDQTVAPALARLVIDRSGLTHHEIARRACCGLLSLRAFRSGRFDLSLAKFLAICTACGVDNRQIVALMAADRAGTLAQVADTVLPDRRILTGRPDAPPSASGDLTVIAMLETAVEPPPEVAPVDAGGSPAGETAEEVRGEVVVPIGGLLDAGSATELAGSESGPDLHDAPDMGTAGSAPASPPSCEGPGHEEITTEGPDAPPPADPAMDAAVTLVAALEVFLVDTPVPETAQAASPDVPPEARSEIRPEPELPHTRPDATEDLARQIADLRSRLEDHVAGAERAQAGFDATVSRLEAAVAATVRVGEALAAEAAKKERGSTLLQRLAVAVLRELATA